MHLYQGGSGDINETHATFGLRVILATAALPAVFAATGSALDEANRPLANVESAFKNLTQRGAWLGWNRAIPPIAPKTASPPIPTVNSQYRYQGVARSPRTGVPPVFYVTRSSDVEDPSNLGSLLVIRLGSRNQMGERLRSNRLGPEETKNTRPPFSDTVIRNIPFPNYGHPGGVQMVGDILAIPLEDRHPDRTSLPESKVVFCDCTNPENPVPAYSRASSID